MQLESLNSRRWVDLSRIWTLMTMTCAARMAHNCALLEKFAQHSRPVQHSMSAPFMCMRAWTMPCSRVRLCRSLGFLPHGWPRKSYRVSNPAASPDPTPNEIDEVRRQLMEEFADVFADSPLKPMKGPPMDIDLRPDAVPSRVHAPRAIPYAYRDQVKTQLDGMVAEGIIESVTEPSDWCHPVVIVAKKGTDEKRPTVDFKKLNDQVFRVNVTRSPNVHDDQHTRRAHLVTSFGEYRRCQVFHEVDNDARTWCRLAEKSRCHEAAMCMPTHNVHARRPWGRYRFLRNRDV